MDHEPITPAPWTSHQWVPLFLAKLATTGDLKVACFHGHVTEAEVETMRAQSGYFDAAYHIIMRDLRKRGLQSVAPAPVAPATAAPPFSCLWMPRFILELASGESVAHASEAADFNGRWIRLG